MKGLLFAVLFLSFSTGFAADEAAGEGGVKGTAKKVTTKVISFGKELMGGMDDGVTEGRKSSEGTDGAVIVSNLEELESSLSVSLLGVSAQGNDFVAVEFGFKNAGDKPVRVINLTDEGALLALDKEGYAYGLTSLNNPSEFTVPERAGIKRTFVFELKEENLQTVRFWGKEIER